MFFFVGVELKYLFTPPSIKGSTLDAAFSEQFCDLWLNFGKYGNPTPEDAEDKRFDKWTPYNVDDEPFMRITGKSTMQFGYRNSWRPNGFE